VRCEATKQTPSSPRRALVPHWEVRDALPAGAGSVVRGRPSDSVSHRLGALLRICRRSARTRRVCMPPGPGDLMESASLLIPVPSQTAPEYAGVNPTPVSGEDQDDHRCSAESGVTRRGRHCGGQTPTVTYTYSRPFRLRVGGWRPRPSRRPLPGSRTPCDGARVWVPWWPGLWRALEAMVPDLHGP